MAERMKRFRWWILALLFVGALLLVLALKPEREPLELAVISRTNDIHGQSFLIVRITNQSSDEYEEVAARSHMLVGKQWTEVPQDTESERFVSKKDRLRAGDTWQVQLPAPVDKMTWRVYVVASRKLGWLEHFIYIKLRLRPFRSVLAHQAWEFDGTTLIFVLPVR